MVQGDRYRLVTAQQYEALRDVQAAAQALVLVAQDHPDQIPALLDALKAACERYRLIQH